MRTMSAHAALSRPRFVKGPGFVGRVLAQVLLWQTRAHERHILGGLDDRMLRDLGLDRADISREVDKPFWRA